MALSGEVEMTWDLTNVLVAAHTAEEAMKVAQDQGRTLNGTDDPMPLEEVSINGRRFRVTLEPVGA